MTAKAGELAGNQPFQKGTGNPRGRQFQKGTSGNPRGRREGSRSKSTLAAETLMQGETDRLTRRCIDAALAGDTVALRLCLERIYPVRKGRPLAFPLPRADTPKGLVAAMAEVVRGAAEGDLTTEEAAGFAQVLEAQRKTIETSDIETRLRKIEEAQAGGAK